jgi:hypothetical protein
MHDAFGYFATWEPGVPLNLGDVGVLDDDVFTRIGTLEQFQIPFTARRGNTPVNMKYASSDAVSIAFKAAGAAPMAGSSLANVDAGVTIEFTRKNAVAFEAIGCKSSSILDQIALGQTILQKYEADQWDSDWMVITELIAAQATTVIVSSSSGGKVELKASGDLGRSNLSIASLSASFQTTFSKNIDTQIVAAESLTPLFRVSTIHRPPFSRNYFGLESAEAATLEGARARYRKTKAFDVAVRPRRIG